MFSTCTQPQHFTTLDQVYASLDNDNLKEIIVQLSTPQLKEMLKTILQSLHLKIPDELERDRTEICRYATEQLLQTLDHDTLVDIIQTSIPPLKKRRKEVVSFSQCLDAPPTCPEGLSPWTLPLDATCRPPKTRYVCGRGEQKRHDPELLQQYRRDYMNFFESEAYLEAFNAISEYLNDFDVYMYFSGQKQNIDLMRIPDDQKQAQIMALVQNVPSIAKIFADAKTHAYYRLPTNKDTWDGWTVQKLPNDVIYQKGDTSYRFAPERSPWVLRPGMHWRDTAGTEWQVKTSIVPNILMFHNQNTGTDQFKIPRSCPFYNPATQRDILRVGEYHSPWVRQFSVTANQIFYFNVITGDRSWDAQPGF